MNDLAVTVENLRRKFGSFVAVDGVSFDIGRGEIFGFLGPNGAGKSTTIRMLCGLLRPTSGEGRVAGFDITRQPEKIKTRIGYMSQKFSLYRTITVEENLDFYAGVYLMERRHHRDRKDEFFRQTELGAFRNRVVSSLPSGARQLLALFCAIQHRPQIVFLDEPTAGVDPTARRYFWDKINSLADEGITVFVTTHYLDEAEECDRVAMIFEGKIAAIGAPAELTRTRFKGRVFRLGVENPLQARSLALTLDGVNDAVVFGSELHLTLGDAANPDTIFRQLESRVSFADAPVLIEPTLEDLFVSLIGEERR